MERRERYDTRSMMIDIGPPLFFLIPSLFLRYSLPLAHAPCALCRAPTESTESTEFRSIVYSVRLVDDKTRILGEEGGRIFFRSIVCRDVAKLGYTTLSREKNRIRRTVRHKRIECPNEDTAIEQRGC